MKVIKKGASKKVSQKAQPKKAQPKSQAKVQPKKQTKVKAAAPKAQPKPKATKTPKAPKTTAPRDLSKVGQSRSAAVNRYAEKMRQMSPRERAVARLKNLISRVENFASKAEKWNDDLRFQLQQTTGFLNAAVSTVENLSDEDLKVAPRARAKKTIEIGSTVKVRDKFLDQYKTSVDDPSFLSSMSVTDIKGEGKSEWIIVAYPMTGDGEGKEERLRFRRRHLQLVSDDPIDCEYDGIEEDPDGDEREALREELGESAL